MTTPVESRAPWDSTRPARRSSPVLLTLAVLATLPSLVLTVLRLAPPHDDATALVASFIPYATVGYAVALVCLLLALPRAPRRRRLAVPAGAVALLLALHLSWLAPDFVPDDRRATSPAFTLLSVNTKAGEANPDQLAQAASDADVVVLVESTTALVDALDERGWRSRFPHTTGEADGRVSSTSVWSRYPLADSALLGGSSFAQWRTTVTVPDVGAVRLLAVHPCNPYCGHGRWASEHAALEQQVRAELDGPLVVAGDFNAVDDHGPMQRLHRLGLRSATDLVGAGWLPTYPANVTLPPLLPIDHVLLDDRLTATSIRRVHVDGTDHLGLRTTIARAG